MDDALWTIVAEIPLALRRWHDYLLLAAGGNFLI